MNRMCLLIPAFLYSCLQLGQIKRPLEDLSNLLNDPKVYLEDDIKLDLNETTILYYQGKEYFLASSKLLSLKL